MARELCLHRQMFTGLLCTLRRWHLYEHRYPEAPSNG